MPHLHLSLQAGDDLVLKRMKRRHSPRRGGRACANGCGALRPGIAFGADIIAGFPTETEAMFMRSLDLVEDCGLTHLHVFPYSPRPGTPAARMPRWRATSPRSGRGGCARPARRRCAAISTARSAGARLVLTENADSGRSEHFTAVRFDRPVEPGVIIEARMSGHDGQRLIAA